MDSNRVQSYIKSHVLPKLDSLPQDVQSVKNAFDAWKADWTTARAIKLDNLDATISSRASSQQVDTTLQRLTTLESSVAKLEHGLASVESDIKAEFDTNPVKIIERQAIEPNVRKTVLNITGKGEFYLAGFSIGGNWNRCSLTVEIDGKSVTIISSISASIATRNRFYYDGSSGSLAVFSNTGSPDSRADSVSVYSGSIVEAEKELFSEDNVTYYLSGNYGSSQSIGRKQPYRFNSGLKVVLDSTLANSETSGTVYSIAYSLDPT